MERLSPLSAAFLKAEDADPAASLAIGSLAVFEPPAPSFEEFVRAIEGRLPLVPRYRQKLRTVPLDLAAPAWVDDPDFDLRWHLRNTALPAPGGPAEIGRLMSRVMASRMDRTRPLWEYWFCEGLADGRWGLLSKLHHSMVDGVSGTDIYRLILDAGREQMSPLADDWQPETPPSVLSYLARGAFSELISRPIMDAQVVGSALRSPRNLARSATQALRGMLAMRGALMPTTATSLVGPLDGSRRFASTTVSLADVRVVRMRLGGSINDVSLAIVSGAFRKLLLARGEEPGEHTLRSLVPVSVREPGKESVRDNQVSLMLPYLPVEIEDPIERLAAVRSRIHALRSAGEPEAGEAFTGLAGLGAFGPVSAGLRLAFHLPQRQIATVTTNVPGPRQPIFGLGRQVEQLIPYVPIADRVRIGIAFFSYCDNLAFGITGDYSTVPDIQVLADGISASLAELLQAADTTTSDPGSETGSG